MTRSCCWWRHQHFNLYTFSPLSSFFFIDSDVQSDLSQILRQKRRPIWTAANIRTRTHTHTHKVRERGGRYESVDKLWLQRRQFERLNGTQGTAYKTSTPARTGSDWPGPAQEMRLQMMNLSSSLNCLTCFSFFCLSDILRCSGRWRYDHVSNPRSNDTDSSLPPALCALCGPHRSPSLLAWCLVNIIN